MAARRSKKAPARRATGKTRPTKKRSSKVARTKRSTRPAAPARVRLAVFKFASCDGCQLSLLDCEDELLAVAEAVEIANFLEASSNVQPGPYDVALVEGSITTAHDVERIQQVRAQSRILVTIGACATAGGIQALRNFADVEEWRRLVYAKPEYVQTLATSTAIADHVKVDFELRGCPIDKGQLLSVLTALVHGAPVRVPNHSVCVECKLAQKTCVTVAHGTPCLGPITQAGCGALCPGYTRGCFGCFGPKENATPAPLLTHLEHTRSLDKPGRLRILQTFNAAHPVLVHAAEQERAR